MSKTKREIRRNPLGTSKQVFEKAGVPDVPKLTRYRIMGMIAKFGKPEVRLQLKDMHNKKRMEWTRDHMKVKFQTALFTDECRVTLDGPDWWHQASTRR